MHRLNATVITFLFAVGVILSTPALAEPLVAPDSRPFAFDVPGPSAAAPPLTETLYHRASPTRRAARFLTESLVAGGLSVAAYTGLRHAPNFTVEDAQSATVSFIPLTAPLGVTLSGLLLGGKGNVLLAIGGPVAVLPLVFILSILKAGPVPQVALEVLATAFIYETSSYLNEISREREQEVSLSGGVGAKETPGDRQVRSTPAAPRRMGFRLQRAAAEFGVTLVGGASLSLAIHYGVGTLIGCTNSWCRFDPTSRQPLQVFPIFATAASLILFPLLTHAFGQWWGGKGHLGFAFLGAYLGGLAGAALFAALPQAGMAWWLCMAGGSVIGWEASSLVRERLNNPSYPEAVPSSASPLVRTTF